MPLVWPPLTCLMKLTMTHGSLRTCYSGLPISSFSFHLTVGSQIICPTWPSLQYRRCDHDENVWCACAICVKVALLYSQLLEICFVHVNFWFAVDADVNYYFVFVCVGLYSIGIRIIESVESFIPIFHRFLNWLQPGQFFSVSSLSTHTSQLISHNH